MVYVSKSLAATDKERAALASRVRRLGGRLAEQAEADAGGFSHVLTSPQAFAPSLKVKGGGRDGGLIG